MTVLIVPVIVDWQTTSREHGQDCHCRQFSWWWWNSSADTRAFSSWSTPEHSSRPVRHIRQALYTSTLASLSTDDSQFLETMVYRVHQPAQQVQQWRSKTRNLSIGDIGVLKEENTIPTKWPLGRIVAVHPGTDGLVRVVDVRTSQGIYRRPITKLALLLGPENSD